MITANSNYNTANARDSKSPIHTVKLSPHPNLLLSAWELDEASGQRADYTGRNELTPSGAPGTAAGKIAAACISMSAGSSQYLYRNVSDNDCLNMFDTSFMITGWVYVTSKAADRYIITKYKTGAGNTFYLQYYTGTDRFVFNAHNLGLVTANTLGSPSTNTWYFICVWFDKDAGTTNISVNNGTTDSVSGSVSYNCGTEPLMIGAIDLGAGATGFFDGRLDNFTIWNRILTSAERTSLYNSGTGASFTTLTDPSPAVFSTGGNSAGENLGSYLLELDELNYETAIDKVETGPISTFTFWLKDTSSAISALVATNLIGYKVRLYSGYYSLAFADFVQVFGGRVTEITQQGARYRFTCRSFLTYAQDKLILDDPQTVLLTAVNTTDTTWNVQDASAFPSATSTPQGFRRVVQIDTEIATYRGKTKLADGTWNLTSVVRSAAAGFPFPPYYGTVASHAANAVVRQLPKLGALTPETNQAASDWMHPIRFALDTLNNIGNQGLGEFVIPLDSSSWATAQTSLGSSLQFRHISGDAINGKSFIEGLCRDMGAFIVERADGSVGIKLIPAVSTLHAAWKLEESSGDRVDVIHTNRSRNYNLTAVNSPGSTTGKIGSAVQLTAASSQYLWRSYGGLQPAASSFSVAAWVYLDSKTATQTICGQWDTSTAADQSWRLIYDQTVDRFRLVVSDGSSAVSLSASTFGSPSTATWYLVIATFNRSSLQMSIGVNNGTVDTTTGVMPVPTTEEFRVGASGLGAATTNFMDGRIDELGLWFDHELTSSEKTWLYNSGSGRAIEDFSTNFPTSSPSSVDTITDSHVLARPQWLRNGENAYNHVIVHYDYVPPTDQYTSTFDYKNQSLIDTVGKDIPLEIFSQNIRSRNFTSSGGIFCWFDATERFLMNLAERIIQRFGREAPFIGGTTVYTKHLIESLNDVTVTFDQVVDLSTGNRSLSSASCEVSKMRHDFRRHVVEYEFAKYP